MTMLPAIESVFDIGGRILLAALLGVLISYRRQADRQYVSIIHSHAYLAVAGAGSGEEALEIFKKERPIVVLLDVKLPGIDGITTLKRIRELSEHAGVIMITGVQDRKLFEVAKKLGAGEYITKPFDLDYLETCLLVRIFLVSALSE